MRSWIVIVISLLLSGIQVSAQTDQMRVLTDIPYVEGGDALQMLDLYLPSETASAPYPVFVAVHGGGFFAGDKAEVNNVAERYAERGYAVIAPNYRLAPDVQFPDAHGDVFCAMAWTFAHADQYQLDTTQITLFGESAGGNIVTYVGAVDDASMFMDGCAYSYPDAPDYDAVIALYAPVDLLSCDCQMARRMASLYTGISYFDWEDEGDIAKHLDLSVVNWLDAGDPPMYLLHGDIDYLVPVSEAEFFVDAYRAVGGEVELVVFEGATHGFLTGYPSPFVDVTYQVMDDWIEASS